ncbi:MAG: hypothetical protein ACE5GV_17100 [Candidatus Scalindua sp.]
MKKCTLITLALFIISLFHYFQTFSQTIEFSFPPKESGFLFKNFTFETFEGKVGEYKLEGTIENISKRDYICCAFSVKLFDVYGKIILLQSGAFNLGETLSEKEFLEGSFPTSASKQFRRYIYPEDKAVLVNKVEIGFIGAMYAYLVETNIGRELRFEDKYVKLDFLPTVEGISFSLKNKSNRVINIDYDKVSYIDINGKSHGVIHSGVRYLDRNRPQKPKIVPPMTDIEDFIFPADYIEWNNFYKNWIRKSLFFQKSFPANILGLKDTTSFPMSSFQEASTIDGSEFGLFFPIKIDGTTRNYEFMFRIDRK